MWLITLIALAALYKVWSVSNRIDRIERKLGSLANETPRQGPLSEPRSWVAPVVTASPQTPGTHSAPGPLAGSGQSWPDPAPGRQPIVPGHSPEEVEASLGFNWSAWGGALLLSLGAVFLVAFSPTPGRYEPSYRLGPGFAFALALIASAEVLRRIGRPLGRGPDIPGLLAGIGATALFGTLVAAEVFYRMLGVPLTFVALVVSACATTLAASLYGRPLAWLGVAGLLLVPVFAKSGSPEPWLVALLVPCAVAVAHAVSARERQPGIVGFASVAGLVWGVLLSLSAFAGNAGAGTPALVLSVALLLVAAWSLVSERDGRFGPTSRNPALAAASFVPAPAALLALSCVAAGPPVSPATASPPLAGLAILLWLAAARGSLRWYAVGAGAFALSVTGAWTWLTVLPKLRTGYPTLPGPETGTWVFAAVAAVLVGLVPATSAVRRRSPDVPLAPYGIAAAATPPSLLALMAYGGGGHPEAFGILAGTLACLYLGGTLVFDGLSRADAGYRPMVMAMTAGVFASLSLALALLAHRDLLPLSFAVAAAVVASFAMSTRIGTLAAASAGLAGASLAAVLSDPFLVRQAVGWGRFETGLVVIYALPAVALALAALAMRGKGGVPVLAASACKAVAGFLGVACLALAVRHDAGITREAASGFPLFAAAYWTAFAFAAALAFPRLPASKEWDLPAMGKAAGGVVLTIAVVLLVFVANPLFVDRTLAPGAPGTDALVSYALAGVMAALLARRFTGLSQDLSEVSFAVSVALGFLGVTVATRGAFNGTGVVIARWSSQAEIYAYTAAWLPLGIAYLAMGAFTGVRAWRLSGFAVLGLTAGKVLLVDTAHLDGPMRAGSCIAMGAVLMLVGFAYQRLAAQAAPGTR